MDLVLAKSKAGHDKNQVYVITAEKDDCFFLVNGTTRTLDKPKRKKKIHLQLIKKIPDNVIEIANESNQFSDLSIKRILKEFNRRLENV